MWTKAEKQVLLRNKLLVVYLRRQSSGPKENEIKLLLTKITQRHLSPIVEIYQMFPFSSNSPKLSSPRLLQSTGSFRDPASIHAVTPRSHSHSRNCPVSSLCSSIQGGERPGNVVSTLRRRAKSCTYGHIPLSQTIMWPHLAARKTEGVVRFPVLPLKAVRLWESLLTSLYLLSYP